MRSPPPSPPKQNTGSRPKGHTGPSECNMQCCAQFTLHHSTGLPRSSPRGAYLHCSTGTIIRPRSISWHSRQANTGTLRHWVWSGAGLSSIAESSVNTRACCLASLISPLCCMGWAEQGVTWMLITEFETSQPTSKPRFYLANHTGRAGILAARHWLP